MRGLLFGLLIVSNLVISQNTILWKVTKTNSDKTSYLVGTFHQFGNSFVDSIPQIQKALLNSELAVFESLDKVEDTRALINSRPSSNMVEKKLKKKDFKKLKELSKDWKVDLYKLKPIEIYFKLAQDYQRKICKTSIPEDTFDLFDDYLLHLAKINNIETFGLEINQLDEVVHKEFKNSNWKNEKKRISAWINKSISDKLNSKDCELANTYRKFELSYDFENKCERNVINSERNDKWMEVIPDLLRTKSTFIAVGYYHLRWQCGLIMQLKKEGFIVEPVKIKTNKKEY